MPAALAIKEFFSATRFAVVGASAAPEKFGNKVLKWYKENNYDVVPINPREPTIEGLTTVPSVDALPGSTKDFSLSVVTPPQVTRTILETAAKLGYRRVWLQPGSEHPGAVEEARKNGVNVISGGPCVLVDGIRKKSKI